MLYKVLFHNFGGSYPPSVTSSRTQDHIIVIALAFYTHQASGFETATHQDHSVGIVHTGVCAYSNYPRDYLTLISFNEVPNGLNL